jgi:biotin carboxyl carrier protein
MSMRRYSIQVNGTTYTFDVVETDRDCFLVTLEDGTVLDVLLESGQDLAPVAGTPSAAPAPAVAARPAARAATPPPTAAASSVSTAGSGAPGKSFPAPMPGVVLSVAVAPGDTVARGQTLLVLEAMKMKNELKAPRDGTVTNVRVKQGDQVKTGDPLIDF